MSETVIFLSNQSNLKLQSVFHLDNTRYCSKMLQNVIRYASNCYPRRALRKENLCPLTIIALAAN